jgi:hypothetical protein
MALLHPENAQAFSCLLGEAASELDFGPMLGEHQTLILQFFVRMGIASPGVAEHLVESNFAGI